MARKRWVVLCGGVAAAVGGIALGHWVASALYAVAVFGLIVAVFSAPSSWVRGASTNDGAGPTVGC